MVLSRPVPVCFGDSKNVKVVPLHLFYNLKSLTCLKHSSHIPRTDPESFGGWRGGQLSSVLSALTTLRHSFLLRRSPVIIHGLVLIACLSFCNYNFFTSGQLTQRKPPTWRTRSLLVRLLRHAETYYIGRSLPSLKLYHVHIL